MDDKKSFTVRIAPTELERLDRARGLIPRERFVREAIERYVEALEAQERAKAPRRKGA